MENQSKYKPHLNALFAPAGAKIKKGYICKPLILWAQQDLNLRPTDYERVGTSLVINILLVFLGTNLRKYRQNRT
jgi:hypothetical protein